MVAFVALLDRVGVRGDWGRGMLCVSSAVVSRCLGFFSILWLIIAALLADRYEAKNLHVAEAAAFIDAQVRFEVPILKRRMASCAQQLRDFDRKEAGTASA